MSTSEANIIRLRALLELMDISIADISRVLQGSYSRPMISRVLNEGLECQGLWAELERRLPEIVSKRRRAYFEVVAVPVGKVETIMETVRQVA